MSGGIPCPKCGARNSRVYDSRSHSIVVKRRRGCKACKARFISIELGCTERNIRLMELVENIDAKCPHKARSKEYYAWIDAYTLAKGIAE